MDPKFSHIYVSEGQVEFPDFSEYLDTYHVKIWKPSLTRIVPPGYSVKYFFYWLAHFLRIFRNRYFSAIYIYFNDELVSSMLIVPAYFKWPFMGKNDVQFCYSMTRVEYRGRGINTFVKLYSRYLYKNEDIRFWGVVDPENHTNIKILKKVGLKFFSEARRQNIVWVPVLYRIVPFTILRGE